MAFDETFRPKLTFDNSTNYDSPAVRQLQPSNFEGPVAYWAAERTRKFGDGFIPRHVYTEVVDGQPHRVAWVYHDGIDPDIGETFERHHIACDCMLEAEHDGEPERMFACEALHRVLNKRAWVISSVYKMEDTMRAIPELPEAALFGGDRASLYDEFSMRSIGYLLEHDVIHPEGWVNNIVDGEHMASLIALIMQRDPDEIREYAERMERAGIIKFDGETIMLTESEKQRIKNDIEFCKLTKDLDIEQTSEQ